MCEQVIYIFVNLDRERSFWRRKKHQQDEKLNTSRSCEDLWEIFKFLEASVKRRNLLVRKRDLPELSQG